MGRDGIVIAGTLGVLAVLALWRWAESALWVLGWPRRYLRARRYELERARHRARVLLDELGRRGTYATVTIPRAEVTGAPPWATEDSLPDRSEILEFSRPYGRDSGPQWQSDLEAAGRPLPEWADPYADRVGAYGFNSGSHGADYHGGELPAAGEGGARRPDAALGTRATAGPGPEPSGAPGPAPLDLPPGWSQPTPPFPDRHGDMPDDPAQDDTWARLLDTWAQEGSEGTPTPARRPGSGAVERGREDDGSTGTATRARELGSRSPLCVTGRGGVVPVTPAAAPARVPSAAADGPGWAPTRLGTRFDAELAAQCSAWLRAQDRDAAEYMAAWLERAERAIGARL